MLNFVEGEILLVDKPLEWTSFDVVKKLKFLIQRVTGKKKIKVGHAGTLDPLASGLLVLCSGKKTKQIPSIQDAEKEYTGEFYLGATTASYDLETEPENFQETAHLSVDDLKKAASKQTGPFMQQPPLFSAKKVNGTRAYKLARQGSDMQLEAKAIEVYEFELTRIELPIVEFRIRCSKGTYIRSMAHDFGKELKVGAYLKSLRRTEIGDYRVSDAKGIEEWVELISSSNVI
ncbi:MAG: tRNA pseudouridine(55) synthase TruB [Flavobacteriales bacterium]|nr:tRNA pseudouridine(55) synthase TruB [Flavobacteriales bacterium]|tara:strand:- start:1246 stop:1941 length:696 start_codon:yes stop_codon:yes gene_type:complete